MVSVGVSARQGSESKDEMSRKADIPGIGIGNSLPSFVLPFRL